MKGPEIGTAQRHFERIHLCMDRAIQTTIKPGHFLPILLDPEDHMKYSARAR